MHHVPFSEIVRRDGEILVHGCLVLHDASSSEPVIFKGYIQLRQDVLGGQDVQVVGFLLQRGEKGSGICQLGVRCLRVVHRRRLWREGPGLVRVVESDSVLAVAPEVSQTCARKPLA